MWLQDTRYLEIIPFPGCNKSKLAYLCVNMEISQSTYKIKLKQFEGPFDLLLFFIRRDELDIYDIPIAKITKDFLEYLENLKKLNIDIASEFIVMAATLIRIKAKMLLPRKELDEDGNEIDPRADLVRKLIEYKKFKEVLDEFRDLESRRSQMHRRGNVERELKKIAETALLDVELESVSLYKLMRTFENLMEKFKDQKRKRTHEIKLHKYKVADQKVTIKNILKSKKRGSFKDIFLYVENRFHAVVTFLAILEMLTAGELKIIPGEGNNNFWLELKTI